MESSRTYHRPLILISIIVLYAIPVLSVLSLGESNLYINIVRLGALIGYVSIFISTVLSNYIREVRLIFGYPFMKVHHWFAALGLISITVHPVTLAIYTGSLLVFIPDFSSWYTFWILAGRPALYIVYVATLAALLRNRLGTYWRYLHGLMYVALTFGFVHGFLMESSLANPLIFVLFLAMLVAAYGVAIKKRYSPRRKSN